ncbi:MAG: hypothetical protein ACE5F8_03190 [Woeseiaceae bacterium]
MSNSFIVLIVLIACCTGVAYEYLRTQAKKRETNEDATEMTAQLEALEERIRVLERIVTEKKFDLKQEIDRL